MRVIRRSRPSQIGCGSAIARRRLVHAQALTAQPSPDHGSPAGQVTVFEIDVVDARVMPTEMKLRTRVDRPIAHASHVVAKRARGW